jgi:hypothetical protein
MSGVQALVRLRMLNLSRNRRWPTGLFGRLKFQAWIDWAASGSTVMRVLP